MQYWNEPRPVDILGQGQGQLYVEQKMQHAFEKMDLNTGLGLANAEEEKLARTMCNDHNAILYLLE